MASAASGPPAPATSPRALADRAAGAAGIAVREARDMAELHLIRQLLDDIWDADPRHPSVTAELLRAYLHTGQYVAVAEDLRAPGRPVIAASVAFLSAPAGAALHSHVTGVLPTARGRSLGFALKVNQRAWALDRGLDRITWTFDPLVRRNAWFNLAKLKARAQEYLVDFYGSMADAVNAGDASDRLFLTWALADPQVGAALAHGPVEEDLPAARAAGAVAVLGVDARGGPDVAWPPPATATTALAQVPGDIEGLRRGDPGLARSWRGALREVLDGALTAGWQVRGIGRDGWYVLDSTAGAPGRADSEGER